MAFTASVGQKEPGPEGVVSSVGASSSAYSAGGANAFGPGREFPMHRHVMSHQAERPQPHFALGEGPKPSTHDFLSLYDKSSQHRQHGSGPVLSPSLTTQDFLQPLERGGGRPAYGEASMPRIDKSTRGENLQSHTTTPAPVERIPPTVIPNYATIQVPYRRAAGVMELPPNSVICMVGEASDEAMRSRGYNGAAQFPREDQNATGSDEIDLDPESVTNARDNSAYWSGVRLKFGLPQDLKFLANNSPAQTASENGAPVKQWTQRMMDVPMRPSRGPSEDDEDEDEDSQERARGNRKDSRFQKGDASQKVDMKSSEIRAGTPRSKHSATEQRRRSKINDRFQMLRDLVPHSEQKRDKASFLLEVIEYIQILQDKVQKYETVEQGRHQERLKSMVWDLCKRGTGSGDEASQINALVFAKEFSPGGVPLDVKQVTEVATELTRSRGTFPSDHVSPSEPATGAPKVQHPSRPASSMHSCVSSLEEKENAALVAQPVAVRMPAQQAIPPAFCRTSVQPKQQCEHLSSRGAPLSNSSENDNPSVLDASHFRVNGYVQGQAPASSPDHQFEARFCRSPSRLAEQVSGPLWKVQSHPQLANVINRLNEAHTGVGSGSSPLRQPPQLHEDATGSLGTGQSQKQLGMSSSDQVSGRDGPPSPQAPLKIQGGVINVSTVYSKGLLDTLTRALQSSGLDLAQANISVQIDLGKNSISADVDTSAKIATTPESSAQSHQSQGRTRPPPHITEPEPVLKKPKVEAGQ